MSVYAGHYDTDLGRYWAYGGGKVYMTSVPGMLSTEGANTTRLYSGSSKYWYERWNNELNLTDQLGVIDGPGCE